MDQRFHSDRFPRSSKYHPDWIAASVSGGANSLWLAEWLAEAVELRPGMRVLDLGCGRAASSIFLHREFGVQVWAVDAWCSAGENLRRVRDAGAEGGVMPMKADARALPFAADFFDAIVSIDAYFYFGTDELYLGNLARFVKPGGPISIAGAAVRDFDGPLPEHLQTWWANENPIILHSAAWWRKHWERSGVVNVELADELPDGWRYWLEWHRTVCPENAVEIQALEADQGRYFGYARAVGRRRADAQLWDPVITIPSQYVASPLLRDTTGG